MDARAPARRTARPALLAPLCAFALALLLAACAPTADPAVGPGASAPGRAAAPAPDPTLGPAAAAVERSAIEAWHRMELGRLSTGAYTTNVLVDLALPPGARWTVEEFTLDGSTYRLRFTADAAPDAAWLVSPAGVERISG